MLRLCLIVLLMAGKSPRVEVVRAIHRGLRMSLPCLISAIHLYIISIDIVNLQVVWGKGYASNLSNFVSKHASGAPTFH